MYRYIIPTAGASLIPGGIEGLDTAEDTEAFIDELIEGGRSALGYLRSKIQAP